MAILLSLEDLGFTAKGEKKPVTLFVGGAACGLFVLMI
jgi:hypothetical protein